MLPLLLAVICFSTVQGFSIYSAEKLCYGATYTLPSRYGPDSFSGLLIFVPREGSEQKIVMNNTLGVDPRYKVTKTSVSVPNLTERDEGTFSVMLYSKKTYNVVNLKILDCSEKESRKYGEPYTCKVPDGAQFLEFTPRSQDKITVLWKHTDPEIHRGGRGRVRWNVWEMKKLTQEDNGYYNFRGKDNVLLRRWKLTVQEEPPIFQYIAIPVGIIIGLIFCCCCVRKCCCTKSSSKSDEAVPQSEDAPALPVYHHNTPQPAETSYSASPQFLAHTHHPNSPINFSNPTSSSINPPDIQPAGTSYSGPSQLPPPYTYHPINSSEPTSSPLDPPVFSPAGVHMSSSQPQVTPQGTASSVPFGSDSLSLAPEHQYELKDLKFPSALSSDTSFSNVYTSDKLNFL